MALCYLNSQQKKFVLPFAGIPSTGKGQTFHAKKEA